MACLKFRHFGFQAMRQLAETMRALAVLNF